MDTYMIDSKCVKIQETTMHVFTKNIHRHRLTHTHTLTYRESYGANRVSNTICAIKNRSWISWKPISSQRESAKKVRLIRNLYFFESQFFACIDDLFWFSRCLNRTFLIDSMNKTKYYFFFIKLHTDLLIVFLFLLRFSMCMIGSEISHKCHRSDRRIPLVLVSCINLCVFFFFYYFWILR